MCKKGTTGQNDTKYDMDIREEGKNAVSIKQKQKKELLFSYAIIIVPSLRVFRFNFSSL